MIDLAELKALLDADPNPKLEGLKKVCEKFTPTALALPTWAISGKASQDARNEVIRTMPIGALAGALERNMPSGWSLGVSSPATPPGHHWAGVCPSPFFDLHEATVHVTDQPNPDAAAVAVLVEAIKKGVFR